MTQPSSPPLPDERKPASHKQLDALLDEAVARDDRRDTKPSKGARLA